MRDSTEYVTLNYLSLKKPEQFFVHGRPDLDPKRSPGLFGRPLDFLLITGIGINLMIVAMHLVITILTLPPPPIPTNITIGQCGTFEGVWNSDQSVLRYWALPYAASPVLEHGQKYINILSDLTERQGYRYNHLRWMKTVDSDEETYCFLSFDERCAYVRSQYRCKMIRTSAKRNCLELGVSNDMLKNASEDCLTLDLAMPGFHGQLLPVVIIFSGFRTYRNPLDKTRIQEPAYTPNDDVIIKSRAIWINARYRLGLLGLFGDMGKFWKKKYGFSNFALLDQIAVLKWVQANIEHFGGNPHNITLFGHGSGATSVLALIEWQAKQKSSKVWFQRAWLASGSVNWMPPDKTLPGRFSKILLDKCGSPSEPVDISYSKQCEEKVEEIHQLSSFALTETLNSMWNEMKEIKAMLDISQSSQQIGWFSSDPSFTSGAPNDWSQDTVKTMFETTPKLDSIIFSSMEEEFNGYPGTELFEIPDNIDLVTKFQKDLNLYRKSDLSDPYTEAWLAESNNLKFRVKKRSKVNFIGKILSALRYTCPQNFIIRKWLSYLNRFTLDRTRFFQIYHAQSPHIPYQNVPGPDQTFATTAAFHGMDILLLTGHAQDYNRATEPYRKLLTQIFLDTVHSKAVAESCEIGGPTGSNFGCKLSSDGAEPIQSTESIAIICKSIDWDKYFQTLALLG